MFLFNEFTNKEKRKRAVSHAIYVTKNIIGYNYTVTTVTAFSIFPPKLKKVERSSLKVRRPIMRGKREYRFAS